MRKFRYSEHCVYTGAMLSFIYSLWFPGTHCLERRFLEMQFLVLLVWFFFPQVPCALEALTVINPLVEIVHSHT